MGCLRWTPQRAGPVTIRTPVALTACTDWQGKPLRASGIATQRRMLFLCAEFWGKNEDARHDCDYRRGRGRAGRRLLRANERLSEPHLRAARHPRRAVHGVGAQGLYLRRLHSLSLWLRCWPTFSPHVGRTRRGAGSPDDRPRQAASGVWDGRAHADRLLRPRPAGGGDRRAVARRRPASPTNWRRACAASPPST